MLTFIPDSSQVIYFLSPCKTVSTDLPVPMMLKPPFTWQDRCYIYNYQIIMLQQVLNCLRSNSSGLLSFFFSRKVSWCCGIVSLPSCMKMWLPVTIGLHLCSNLYCIYIPASAHCKESSRGKMNISADVVENTYSTFQNSPVIQAFTTCTLTHKT